MTTNDLMRQLVNDLPDVDQRHLVEVVDRNHAEQLARKRHANDEDLSDAESSALDD